jgi:Mg2+ and Co2+ transporter CorA
MQTVYYLMASLCLAQRTLSLYYSNEISDICKRMNDESLKGSSLYNEVRELNRDYLRFVNNIFFREITPQDQGAELYNLMQNQMHVGRDEKELNTEIEQLYQYVNMTGDQRRNKEAQDLNLIATLMLPATVIAGIFGMNSLSEVNLGFGIEVVVIVVFSIIMFYAIKILGKK